MYVYIFNAGIAINSGDWPVITELDNLVEEVVENLDSVEHCTKAGIASILATVYTDTCFIIHSERLYDGLMHKADIVFKECKIIKTCIPRYLSSLQIIAGVTGAAINQCLNAMAYALDYGIDNPLECAVQYICDMRE